MIRRSIYHISAAAADDASRRIEPSSARDKWYG